MTTAPAQPQPTSAPPATPYSETGWPAIAREGWPIVGMIGGASLVLIVLFNFFFGPGGFAVAVLIGAPLTLWSVWFFRDPARQTPRKPGLVISPADGVVCFIGPSAAPPEMGLPGPMTRVSIFMNVFNVHVNRCPCTASVEAVHYRPGAFFNASFDKASEQNERCGLVLRLEDGRRIVCVQIAGLIARRIVCRAKPGDSLGAGQRFGMIRFGSRLDVYLPEGVAAAVHIGQKAVAGESVLADLNAVARGAG